MQDFISNHYFLLILLLLSKYSSIDLSNTTKIKDSIDQKIKIKKDNTETMNKELNPLIYNSKLYFIIKE